MTRPIPQDRPEGMRAQQSVRRSLRTGAFGALLLLCACFAIAIGDEPARLVVRNHTQRVLAVVVADQSYPEVAPGSEATYETSGGATVSATVAYAAGQGVEGTVRRTFVIAAYHPGGTTGTGVYFACSTSGVVTNPAMGGPVFWNVTSDTLAAR